MDRSQMMASVKSKNTKPEMLVRRLVHSMGYRYRLHCANLPGKPDLVFPSRAKIIFVHGCFWHQHGCRGSHIPKSNVEYWKPKLERNSSRDLEQIACLIEKGWKILILWECELTDAMNVRIKIEEFLGGPLLSIATRAKNRLIEKKIRKAED